MTLLKIKIVNYTGYGNANKLVCRGRVLVDKDTDSLEHDSFLKDFIKSYRRVESNEIPYQVLNAKWGGFTKEIKTNSEGFYLLEQKFKDFEPQKRFETFSLSILKAHKKDNWLKARINTVGKIMFPPSTAKFGVVSDIDDTILKSDVLSRFKLKMFYNALFVKASKRMPIYDANTWYNKLLDGNGKEGNPFFYVSHSPWNLYTYLNEFLSINNFPEGPVLLRDFGMNKKDALQNYKTHKADEVENILKMYPKLPFILIGDGGEKDAHIYLKLKEKYPKQIKAIFIRRLGDAKHQAKIEKLSKGHEEYFFFIKKATEGIAICEKLGFISE